MMNRRTFAGALGAAVRGINIRDLKRARIPVPPRGEQDAIASTLDRQADDFSRLDARCREAISLLNEHRSALITAAVTGQIEVASRIAHEVAA